MSADNLAELTEQPLSGGGVAIAQAQQPPQISPEDRAEVTKHPLSFAPERISVGVPKHAVPIAVPLQITLTLAPGRVIGPITVLQKGPLGEEVTQASGPATVVSEEELTKTIQVLPAQLGRVTFRIGVLYSDNAYAEQTLAVNVVPTAKGLKKFTLGLPSAFALVVEKTDQGKTSWLHKLLLTPRLTYEGLKYPVNVTDISAIHVSVEQPQDNPVIEIDKSGEVHPLRVGTATIVGDIDGVKDRVQVTVFATEKDVRPLRHCWMN